MAIPNPISAVIDFLQADAEVLAQVGTKVFAPEVPKTETEAMPQKCIVLQANGAPADRGRIRLMKIRLEFRAYGATPFDAWGPYLAAYDAFKHMQSNVQGTVLLLDAEMVEGPFDLRDPDLDWPFVMGTVNLMAAEVAV